MRIISGMFGGRRFNPPAGIPARPTTDLAKGALFNTLENMMDLDGIAALDLFGGTGSISYELISRGAASVTVVEKDNTTINFVKKTAKDLAIEDQLHIVRSDVFRYIGQCTEQYDLIFADPPYALANIDDLPMLVFAQHMLKPGGVFVLEHMDRNDYSRHPNYLRMKNYGSTVFSYFKQPNEL